MTCPPLSENAVYIPIDESFWASLENQAQEFGSGSGTLSGSGSFGNFGMMCPFECLECFSGEDCSIREFYRPSLFLALELEDDPAPLAACSQSV